MKKPRLIDRGLVNAVLNSGSENQLELLTLKTTDSDRYAVIYIFSYVKITNFILWLFLTFYFILQIKVRQ